MTDKPVPNEAPHPLPPTGNPPPQDADKPAEGFPKGITPREVKDREKERERREAFGEVTVHKGDGSPSLLGD